MPCTTPHENRNASVMKWPWTPAARPARVNYLMACWFGPRRVDERAGPHFAVAHLRALQALQHGLAQVTVIVPESPGRDAHLAALAPFARCGGAPVVVLTRENSGMSYGSWSHAYDVYGDQFDYYILMEDDYVPCLDHFDRALLERIDAWPTAGYLCTYYETHNRKGYAHWKPHAAISNGMMRAATLAAVKRKFGRVPYLDGAGYVTESQIVFSHAVLQAGHRIRDFRRHYSCPYLSERTRQVVEFGNPRRPPLLAPLRC
jgi:hypothetical protein